MNIIKSTGTFSFYTLISRILGYLRDFLIAIFLGSGPVADAFFVAFRIPNTFRRLFGEGSFNAAFVPSYSKELIKKKIKSEAFANDVFNLLALTLLILVIIVELFMPFFVSLIAPGFKTYPEKFLLAIQLTKITFPFIFFVSLASFFSAILNSHNRFAAASAAPIILNILMIGVLLFGKILDEKLVVYLSYAVTFAGFIQAIFLMIFVKKFFHLKIKFNFTFTKEIKIFLKKLLPSIFSSGVTQINILIGTIIASFQASAVSYLYYADRIYQINLAIAGIAIGTVILPKLSSYIQKNKIRDIHRIQNKSLELSLLLSLPASLALIIGSDQIVNALFGYGSFTENDIEQTSLALRYFGYGIPAFAALKIFANFFFARDNTMTPFRISLVVVIINVFVSVLFFKQIGFVIIPIATTLSTWIGVFYYLYILLKIGYLKIEPKFYIRLMKILFSTSVVSYAFHYCLNNFAKNLSYSSDYKIIYLLFIVIFVALLYFLICYFLKIFNLRSFKTN